MTYQKDQVYFLPIKNNQGFFLSQITKDSLTYWKLLKKIRPINNNQGQFDLLKITKDSLNFKKVQVHFDQSKITKDSLTNGKWPCIHFDHKL